MTASDRLATADANLISAFDLVRMHAADPRGGRSRFGAVDAIAVGIASAFFNPVLALDPGSAPADALAGIAWVEARGLPVSIQSREDHGADVRAAVEAQGLVADPWVTPVMVLDPIPTAPPPPSGVVIRTGGPELGEDFHVALESREVFRRIFGPAFLADPRVIVAVGYLDAEPVSSAAAIRSGSTIGIYAVGTREKARRRGIGRAVTWAAISAGVEAWTGTIAVLQSSEMGVPVYRSMGFEAVGGYIEHARPKA
jgi:GNAT superfamily N-acetyltransferase